METKRIAVALAIACAILWIAGLCAVVRAADTSYYDSNIYTTATTGQRERPPIASFEDAEGVLTPKVLVGGTAATTISGTANVLVKGGTSSVVVTGTPSVTVSGGTTDVVVTGTPTVTVSGTSAVTGDVGITGTAAVAISGTPTTIPAQGSAATVTVITATADTIAANPNRVEVLLVNTGTVRAYALTGSACTTGSYSVVVEPASAADRAGGSVSMTSYTGVLSLALDGTGGKVMATEVSR